MSATLSSPTEAQSHSDTAFAILVALLVQALVIGSCGLGIAIGLALGS